MTDAEELAAALTAHATGKRLPVVDTATLKALVDQRLREQEERHIHRPAKGTG